MSVTIACPYCGTVGELDEYQEGAKVRCLSCGENFILNDSSSNKEPEATSPTQQDLPRDIGTDPSRQATPPENSHQTDEEHPKSSKCKAENDGGSPTVEASMPNNAITSGNILLKSLMILMAILMAIMCLQMINISKKLDVMQPGKHRITDTKLIHYSWDDEKRGGGLPEMEREFKWAVWEGYEPVGYVCPNGVRGGFFLFVKRSRY